MSSEVLSIDCWVYGEDVESTFPIEISSTKNVGALKNAIKEEQFASFRDRSARELALYIFPIPNDNDEQQLGFLLDQWNPRDKTKLHGRTKLSNLSLEACNQEYLIIIDAPTFVPPAIDTSAVVSDLTLNCWVRGQETHRIFPVEISKTKTVQFLKEAIKRKKDVELRDIPADILALYHVSVRYNPQVLEGLAFDHDTPLVLEMSGR
ncbi:hypothetical protein J3R83DRAFT_8763 [Lanmaoa asiatica]|nr:hypothetical protein J3R83DRAFT_8763 [Lanmaoa asiatica]